MRSQMLCHTFPRAWRRLTATGLLLSVWLLPTPVGAEPTPSTLSTPAMQAAVRYAQAIAKGDRVATGQLDFACQYRMVTNRPGDQASFPEAADPIYRTCWKEMAAIHAELVEQRDQGVDLLWPGKGGLVFLDRPLERYLPSVFVMDLLGMSPPGGGLTVTPVRATPQPVGAFRLDKNQPTVGAPTTLVELRIAYQDPLTAPVAYPPGTYRWTTTIKRPRAALKAVTVKWVVLTDLKRLGFPGDAAVVNQRLTGVDGKTAPFLEDAGGYLEGSAALWQPEDAPGVLIAAVGKARQLPELKDRLALLNRVLMIDPHQRQALALLAEDLYQAFLAAGAETHRVSLGRPALAARFNELYWNEYSQTDRLDLSLTMEMGGKARLTPADYLYRMIPAMVKLAELEPRNFENRLRLGAAYRWVNDQNLSIGLHEELLKDIPEAQKDLRTRALIELAWSRISRVAWNRSFDDPHIAQALKEAEEAFRLAEQPLDKFTAAYTIAYGLLFTPKRDNGAILDRLTQAQQWFEKVPGATPESWRYLLMIDTFKGVVQSDPAFEPLLAASPHRAGS